MLSLQFWLLSTHTGLHGTPFILSVSYINLALNPADLNDPSKVATAASRHGRRDKDERWRRKRKTEEEPVVKKKKEGLYLLLFRYDKTTAEGNTVLPHRFPEDCDCYMCIAVTHYYPPSSALRLMAYLPPILSSVRKLMLQS